MKNIWKNERRAKKKWEAYGLLNGLQIDSLQSYEKIYRGKFDHLDNKRYFWYKNEIDLKQLKEFIKKENEIQ